MISVRDLVKRFGRSEVLSGVSLDVAPGEVRAIMGPSGGGKSTLLRCLNGLERFEGGAIAVGGDRLTPEVHTRRDAALLRRIRRRVGFVFQQFHLFPHLTVLENLIEAPVHVLGLERERAVARARQLLERVGLPHKLEALPRQLSGGQQQRVAIARALAMEPEVMLFDEPTSALDPAAAAGVQAVIAELARGGQTMVVVTHSVAFATATAAQVTVLSEGRVVESGPAAQTLRAPRHPSTRAFLAAAR
ncbi:MAG: amino acid ABC transporter ATP-binding protein [Deltaproteobacteria bacterium]|nr:amino acid ABC transporter ATP-binding protein [Deltaproteobacteria bacterium]